MPIDGSIDFIIYIIFHFSFVTYFLNSESVSITLDQKLLFLSIFVGLYANIASFQPLNRIQLSPMGAYSRGGGLL